MSLYQVLEFVLLHQVRVKFVLLHDDRDVTTRSQIRVGRFPLSEVAVHMTIWTLIWDQSILSVSARFP